MIMRSKLLGVLILTYLNGNAQILRESSISNVENGLIKQSVIPINESKKGSSILVELQAERVNGMSVAVINDFKIEWAKAYGVADKSKGNPVTTETLFQCASIGKVITTMAALKLVRDGKVGLDENINNKLTSWRIEENEFTVKEKVTLRRLLTHTAGLLDDYGFEGYKPIDKIPTLLQILNNQPPSNAKKIIRPGAIPAATVKYSGGGFLVIQQMIEDITRQSFKDYVTQNIFTKLEMTNSTYDFFPDVVGNKSIARGHYRNGNIDKRYQYLVYPELAAAGFWTTAVDLAKLVIEIQKEYKGVSELILNQQLCKEMLTPQKDFRGLGVHLVGAARAEAFWHAGNNAGYVGLFYGLVDSGKGAVVLTNSDAGENIALKTVTSIATTYNWPVMKTYNAIEIKKAEIIDYIGTYIYADSVVLKIGENRKGLFMMPVSPKKEIPLYKLADNEFTFNAPDCNYLKMYFDKKEGTVTGIYFIQNLGKTFFFKKIKD